MPRHFGHTKIRYQQVGLFSLYDVESFGPGIRAERLVTSPLQKLAHSTSHLGPVVVGYITAMITHYRLAHSQAHPGTLAGRLGREKWVEHLFPKLRRYARP